MQSLAKYRKPDTNKTLGIELECLVPKVFERYKHYGFFWAGEDVSIDRDNWSQTSCEFVSQPLSAPWLKKEILKLGKKVGPWKVNSSCGIHIHVSRKWLSESKAKKIFAFLSTLDPHDQLDLFGRFGNDFCSYKKPWGRSRYLTINSENKDTFEFRMFASGSPAWATYCVDMAVYLIENADHLNLDAMCAFKEMCK